MHNHDAETGWNECLTNHHDDADFAVILRMEMLFMSTKIFDIVVPQDRWLLDLI